MSGLLAAAEPSAPRRLGELIERLEASGRLRTILPTGAAGVTGVGPAARHRRPCKSAASRSTRAASGASSVFVAVPGSMPTVTTSWWLRPPTVPPQRSWRGPLPGRPFCRLSSTTGAAPGQRCSLVVWRPEPRTGSRLASQARTAKTTTSYLAAAVLEAAGISTGFITTAAAKVGGVQTANPEHVTTPEAPQLQRMLRAMVQGGNRAGRR